MKVIYKDTFREKLRKFFKLVSPFQAFFLVLIVGALPLTVILILREQDIRQKAEADPLPIGWLDVATCERFAGWACDASDSTRSAEVHFYMDGEAGAGLFIGKTTADIEREPAVGDACGGNRMHGFSFAPPQIVNDGISHAIYAHAINIGTTAKNPLLLGSAKTIVCGSASTPSATLTPVASPTNTTTATPSPTPTKAPTKTPTPLPTKKPTPTPTKKITPTPTKFLSPTPTKKVGEEIDLETSPNTIFTITGGIFRDNKNKRVIDSSDTQVGANATFTLFKQVGIDDNKPIWEPVGKPQNRARPEFKVGRGTYKLELTSFPESRGVKTISRVVFRGIQGNTQAKFLFDPTAGDINSDGKIDIEDYNILISNYGKRGNGITNIGADINGDSFVDQADYSLVTFPNFGKIF